MTTLNTHDVPEGDNVVHIEYWDHQAERAYQTGKKTRKIPKGTSKNDVVLGMILSDLFMRFSDGPRETWKHTVATFLLAAQAYEFYSVDVEGWGIAEAKMFKELSQGSHLMTKWDDSVDLGDPLAVCSAWRDLQERNMPLRVLVVGITDSAANMEIALKEEYGQTGKDVYYYGIHSKSPTSSMISGYFHSVPDAMANVECVADFSGGLDKNTLAAAMNCEIFVDSLA